MEYKITEKITEKVVKEILNIKEKKGLTAEEVLSQAQKKNSALHDFFTWDDSVAAEKYRLQQARILINEVKIIVNTEEYYAFENVNIKVNDSETEPLETTRQYFTRDEIISTPSLRQQIILRAYNNIIYWKKQYECYAEFQPIIEGIKRVEEQMEQKKVNA
jgi:hypothetical protein